MSPNEFTINLQTISNHVDTKVYSRGEALATSGAVQRVDRWGDLLTGKVEGSEYDPYDVTIQLRDGEPITANCSCPYDLGGWCKHVVALALFANNHPEEVAAKTALSGLLTGLSPQELVTLITKLVGASPELLPAVEYFVADLPTKASKPAADSGQQGAPSPDLDQIQSRISAGLRARLSPSEVIATDLAAGLDLAYAAQADEAMDLFLLLAEMLVDRLVDAIDDVSDPDDWDRNDYYAYEEGVDLAEVDALLQLDKAWGEACLALSAQNALPSELVESFIEDVKDWNAEIASAGQEAVNMGVYVVGVDEGEELLGLVVTAAQSAWDGLSPLAVDEDGWFDPRLIHVQLQALDRLGRHDAYLRLATESGEVVSLVGMLAKLGRTAEAEEQALAGIDSPGRALAFAQALDGHGLIAAALRVAEQGLDAPVTASSTPTPFARFSGLGSGLVDLGTWLTDTAYETGNMELAIKAAAITLLEAPSLNRYKKLVSVAGEQWSLLRPDIFDRLRQKKSDYNAGTCEIFLAEGEIRDAINSAPNYLDYGLAQRLFAAATPVDPDWVVKRAGGPAAAIMDAGKSNRYDEAVNWLRFARDAYVRTGQPDRWRSYLANIRSVHGKKYKLMGLLKNLD